MRLFQQNLSSYVLCNYVDRRVPVLIIYAYFQVRGDCERKENESGIVLLPFKEVAELCVIKFNNERY